jgi:ribosomal protein S18 acetylase RimI-like enzyme
MQSHERARNSVEWRLARSEDAEIWVSITRRSADQMTFEEEDAQIARFKEEPLAACDQRYLLWRDGMPIGRLRFSSHDQTAKLDGLVLLPEAGGSVAVQVVSEALVRSAALGARYVHATYPAAYIASFASAGFLELRRRTGMVGSTDVAVPLLPLPASLRLREMAPDEHEQIGILLNRAYTGGPDDLHSDASGWSAEVLTLQEGRFGPFLPESCFVVEHSLDRYHLAGAILLHMERGVPRIRHMVVAPAFRHVGLGQFLAVKAMRRLHAMSYPVVTLSVTLGIPAVNLYHRLGFIEAGPTYIEAERGMFPK